MRRKGGGPKRESCFGLSVSIGPPPADFGDIVQASDGQHGGSRSRIPSGRSRRHCDMGGLTLGARGLLRGDVRFLRGEAGRCHGSQGAHECHDAPGAPLCQEEGIVIFLDEPLLVFWTSKWFRPGFSKTPVVFWVCCFA